MLGTVAARLAEPIRQSAEGLADVAEGDVAPESVVSPPCARHAGEVHREPERDERPDPPEVLGLDEPEQRPVAADPQTIVDCVEVERRPLSRGVTRERAEPRLVPRGAGELRGHGQTRSRLWTLNAQAPKALAASVSGRIRVRSVASASQRSASRAIRRAWTSAAGMCVPADVQRPVGVWLLPDGLGRWASA